MREHCPALEAPSSAQLNNSAAAAFLLLCHRGNLRGWMEIELRRVGTLVWERYAIRNADLIILTCTARDIITMSLKFFIKASVCAVPLCEKLQFYTVGAFFYHCFKLEFVSLNWVKFILG